MKKRFWTRLISAVLTMAMAFSILAVPVSAASSGNSWAYGKVNEDGSAEWTTEAGVQVAFQLAMEQQGGSFGGATLDAMEEEYVETYREELAREGIEYPNPNQIPDGACYGVTIIGGNRTRWYGEEAYKAILKAGYAETDFTTGEIRTIAGVQLPTVGESNDSVATPNPDDSVGTPDPDDSTGTTEPDYPVITPDPDAEVDWNWATVQEERNVKGYVWTPAIVFVQQYMGRNPSTITAAEMERIKEEVASVDYYGELKAISYDETAYMGFSNKKEEEPRWFTEEAMDALYDEESFIPNPVYALDEGGNLTLKDSQGTVFAIAKPIGSEEGAVPEPSTRVVTVIGLPAESAHLIEAFSGLFVWTPYVDEVPDEKEVNQVGGAIRYDVEIPANVPMGFSYSLDGEIFWYTNEEIGKINSSKIQTVTLEEDGTLEVILSDGATASASAADTTPSIEVKPTKPSETETTKPSETEPAAGDSSSDDGAGVAVVAVVGAAAAATGVYLYTHPEKVEAIKDFFADLSANVQAKVEQFTTNVKGAFGIVVPDSEDEEAEPAAVTVEEAQAA